MPQPPTTRYLAHETIKAVPFAAQKTSRSVALAAAGVLFAEFDVGEKITDPNSLLAGAAPVSPSGLQPQIAIGPFLDALWFSDQTGRIDVNYAVDASCAYFTMFQVLVAANIGGNISGLRVTGRFVQITYTNTSAVNAVVEFGVYIRST